MCPRCLGYPPSLDEAHQVLVDYVGLWHVFALPLFGFNTARYELRHEVHAVLPSFMQLRRSAAGAVVAALIFDRQVFCLGARERTKVRWAGKIVGDG